MDQPRRRLKLDPTPPMRELAAAIERRAPGHIATRWRGKRLVITGTTRSGKERVVYLELKRHGEIHDWEVRSRASNIWPHLPRIVMYEGFRAIGGQALEVWVRECREGGMYDGAPGPPRGSRFLPG